MANLAMALQHRLAEGALSPESMDRIVAAIDEAAVTVEKA